MRDASLVGGAQDNQDRTSLTPGNNNNAAVRAAQHLQPSTVSKDGKDLLAINVKPEKDSAPADLAKALGNDPLKQTAPAASADPSGVQTGRTLVMKHPGNEIFGAKERFNKSRLPQISTSQSHAGTERSHSGYSAEHSGAEAASPDLFLSLR